ncbi:quinoprotein dehydrogenase-associated putative ABC transporter substrate-binding protein [Ramlibacter sp.]|uniref:quinoprotein dehydrogenase-associated putative ABC transporter substrate-binding protein n=1 Tax=Ramlibacter sp. TaxID=1917967 RepID=UPI002D0B2BCC|nr:quinoprotein dehydrogenase-associated putative ABC transporter substrate-binding protein [Ramlibacter sp.]HWI80490.1 quinoprotein dehydrogenase-associated putative ABC transporter substrate-binding protein [Ramlibacter sp.]
MRHLGLLALCVAGAAAAPAARAADPQPLQALRVCADPDNLPLSHRDGTGFENRIAQLAAQDLRLPLTYEWLPDRRGFVRKTLGTRLCDVIIGVPAQFERTQNTRPYYRSSYVWVERERDGIAPSSFDDPRLARLRIGVQLIGNDMAASPPGAALARHGLIGNVAGYPVAGEQPSGQRMAAALAAGEIDAALVWGPQVGYFARRAPVPLRVRALAAPAGLRGQPFEFAIAMGVRRGDDALRQALDDFIQRRQPDIDRVLAEYAVPTARVAP